MVTQHESLVKDTVNNVSDITEGINLTNNLMQQSSQTMQKLKGVCFEADTNVANATKLVNELADYSKNVYAIVNSISDISEQTNVLSINAAIEASHSGKEGQGFAVVAGEIRSLANQSSTNAKKIHDILITMIEMIARIQTQENVVSENLKDLVAENAKTEESINQVFNVLNNQLDQSKKITNTISSLVKTVHTISDQTKIQKDSSEQLNQSLELLTSITESVVTSVKEQKSSHDSLATELANIQSASEENVNVTNTLKQLFENGTQYI